MSFLDMILTNVKACRSSFSHILQQMLNLQTLIPSDPFNGLSLSPEHSKDSSAGKPAKRPLTSLDGRIHQETRLSTFASPFISGGQALKTKNCKKHW